MSDKNQQSYVPPAISLRRNPGGGFKGVGEKPRNMKATLLRLWGYFKQERKALVVIFLLVMVTAGVALLAPKLIGSAVDALGLVPERGMGQLYLMAILLSVAYVADGTSAFLQGFMMAGISQRTVRLLRSALFNKFQALPISFFDGHAHGDLMSRLTNDIDNISSTISTSASQLMGLLVSLIGSLVMMLILSPLLTASMIIPSGLALLLTRTITTRTGPLFSKQQRQLGALTAQLEESITGINVVRGFNREDEMAEQFGALNNQYFRASLMALVWSGFLMPLMNVLNNLSMVLVGGLGSELAIRGLISVGVIATFVGYSEQFIRPLNDIASIYNTLQTAVAGAERVFEIFDEAQEVPDAPNAIPLEHVKGDVEFEHVKFGYVPEVMVLKDISFTVPHGTSLALVGETGSGKTTIVNLLSRFYEINGGSIKIDGEDIRHYTRASLRSAFGIVLQETHLFTGTIKDNIRYGNPEATDEMVIEAGKRASAHGFIMRLPKAYDTELVESGQNLSAGERQLLSIARAILADQPILILDEATSNVDTRTELRIQKAMLELMHGRTTFIIAHRLSTISGADRILVIDDGYIAEQGSHEELLKQGGVYAKMWFSQLNNDE